MATFGAVFYQLLFCRGSQKFADGGKKSGRSNGQKAPLSLFQNEMEHKEDEVTTIYSTVPLKLYKPITFQTFLYKGEFTTLIYLAFIVINH